MRRGAYLSACYGGPRALRRAGPKGAGKSTLVEMACSQIGSASPPVSLRRPQLLQCSSS